MRGQGRQCSRMVVLTMVFAVVALLLGVLVYQKKQQHQSLLLATVQGTILNKPRAIKPFSLTETDGVPFNNTSLRGHWTLLFFGFTHCGSICPTTMAELSKMTRILEAKGVSPLPRVVMISVDPSGDSLAGLRRYVTAFHPSFSGARGDEASIKMMAHEMGIAYTKLASRPGDKPQNDNIEHTGTLLLLNTRGELYGFFTMPHHASQLARDVQLLIS